MGVKSLSCCGNQDENTISNFRVPESDIISISSDTQKYIEDKEILLSLAPKSSLQNCYDFIISSDYYSLILKGVSPYNLISKITKNLKNSELFSLVTKLMEFINKYENTKNLLIIDNIKSNLELGTKKLLKEINNNILSDNKIDMNKRGEAIKYYKEVDGFMNNIIKNYKK